MSSAAQITELQAQIWKITNDVRGSADEWDFQQYVLGSLFYRFISENFSNYIERGDNSVNYVALSGGIITKDIKLLKAKIGTTVAKIDLLRAEIDKIVIEIEL